MSHPRILIVGGVAGGASAATRARRMNEHAEIVVFEAGEHVSFANCGLPYYIGGQITERGKLLVATPAYLKGTFNIDVRTGHEALRIDRTARRVEVLNRATGQTTREGYDKLILSPGASPVVPAWVPGGAGNVFTLRDIPDTDRIKAWVDERQPTRAVVIGAGYIGLEVAEALHHRGVKVTIVEQLPQVLPLFDPEMAGQVEAALRGNGVEVLTGQSVQGLGLSNDGLVNSVNLAGGEALPADLVLVAIGVRPNVKLAAEAGLMIGDCGAIAVNEYMQTSDADVYAVGDAAETVHVVHGKPVRIPLAGPANRNGRLAGEHAATGHSAAAGRVAGTAVIGLFGKAAAATGLSEKAARQAGYEAGSSYAIRGHHVGYYPGAQQMVLKLVYERGSRKLLGAQAVGGEGVDKRIDVAATVLHFGGSIDDLAWLDLTYAPQFGAAKDPLHIAAFVAANQENGLVKQAAVGDFGGTGAQLLDVRSPQEFAAGALPGAVNIPLGELRKRLGELNHSKPVYVYCGVGQRAWNACRILSQNGFVEVWNIAGGVTLNPPDRK